MDCFSGYRFSASPPGVYIEFLTGMSQFRPYTVKNNLTGKNRKPV